MRKRFYRLVVYLAVHHPFLVMLVATLVTALSVWAAWGIEVQTNLAETLGTEVEVIETLRNVGEQFPGTSTVFVAIEGQNQDRMIEAALRMEAGFEERSDIVNGVYLREPLDFFREHAFLYTDRDSIRDLRYAIRENEALLQAMVEDPSLLGMLRVVDNQVEQLTAQLPTRQRIDQELGVSIDPGARLFDPHRAVVSTEVDPQAPVRSIDQALEQLFEELPAPPSEQTLVAGLQPMQAILTLITDLLEQGPRLDEAEIDGRVIELVTSLDTELAALPPEFDISPDGQMLLFEVAARGDIYAMEANRPFIDGLREVMRPVQLAYPELDIGLAGYPVIYRDEQSVVLENFAFIFVLGLLGVVTLFMLGFRKFSLPVLASIPLLMGVCWTIGIQALAFGDLNIISLVFPVLMVGLGIDFGIHLLSAYSQHRDEGEPPEQALETTFAKVGDAMLTGGLTTAVAFLVMLVASFQGSRSLGAIAGIGVLMAILSMVMLFPVLIIWKDRQEERKGRRLPNVRFEWLAGIARFSVRHAWAVLAAFLAMTLFLAYQLQFLVVEKDALALEPSGLAAIERQHSILEHMGESTDIVAFVANDWDDLQALDQLVDDSVTFGDSLSLLDLMPPDQEANLPAIGALSEDLEQVLGGLEPRPARRYAEGELAELSERLVSLKVSLVKLSLGARLLYGDEVSDALGLLRDTVNTVARRVSMADTDRLVYLDQRIAGETSRGLGQLRRMAGVQPVTLDDLPSAYRDRLRGQNGSFLLLGYPRDYVWDPEVLPVHIDEIETFQRPALGTVPVFHTIYSLAMNDLPLLSSFTALVVALLVVLDLRSFKGLGVALVPLNLAILWTMGTLPLIGVQLNVVSILAIPLLIGIGIDNGIHIYHRIRYSSDEEIPEGVVYSGKPVVLTSLTTAIGFGSLLVSVHRGLFFLGLNVLLGILYSALAAIVLLPALVHVFGPDPKPTAE